MNSLLEALSVFPVFGWIASFVLGSIVGSFLNVCIYRIPEGKSIVYPGSRCGCCGAPIRWYDNIPIFSWIRLRGKARCCGAAFSIRYPLVEFLTAVLFLIAWIQFPPIVALCAWVFIGLLVPLVFIDLDHFFIPDRFSVGGLFVGVLLSALVPELHGYANPGGIAVLSGLGSAVIGALVGSAVVYWFGAVAEIVFRKEAMGQGDVKLAGCFGAFCGWQGAVFSLFGGALIGTVVLMPYLIWARFSGKKQADIPVAADADSPEEEEPMGFGSAVPFGPMLCTAVLLYFFWLAPLVDAWFSEVWEILNMVF